MIIRLVGLASSLDLKENIENRLLKMLYQLTANDIAKGYLDTKSFPQAAGGGNIVVCDLSTFPHYEKLQKNIELSGREKGERTRAIYEKIKDDPMVRCYAEENERDTREIAATIAEELIYWDLWDHQRVALDDRDFRQHFALVHELGFWEAHKSQKGVWTKINSAQMMASSVCPGIWKETPEISYKYLERSASSLVFVAPNTPYTLKKTWAEATKLPLSAIGDIPEDKAILYSQLVNARTMHQIEFLGDDSSKSGNHLPLRYYAELDASMAARTILRQADIGRETCDAFLHSYYLDMLHSTPEFWFAASLEDFESPGREPRDFFTTYRAVQEIRLRILIHCELEKGTGINRAISSRQMQYQIGRFSSQSDRSYLVQDPVDGILASETKLEDLDLLMERSADLVSDWQEDASEVCAALNQLHSDGIFTDPFAQRLVRGILAAGHYFMPGQVYLPR